MKVLIVGSGGREHALTWKLAQDRSVTKLHAVGGNPGIGQYAQSHAGVDPDSPSELRRLVGELGIDLTVIGPEAPLVTGVVDELRTAGHRVIGPTREQARLEGSKVFAKQFFATHNIPTARSRSVTSIAEVNEALDAIGVPAVIKADGLAAGKGVIIAQDRAEAIQASKTLGFPLVIEEFLHGEEVSFIVLSDGGTFVPFEPCQDHKRVRDNDQGPNTGGMGAYCDSRILTEAQTDSIIDRIIEPTIAATGFTGFLYAGLMMTEAGPKLLEFNVRLGDPETQPILHRMVADFGQVLLAASEKRLSEVSIEWRPDPSVCVVMAAAGYPQSARIGDRIHGVELAESSGATVFQAGTRQNGTHLETNGGRVLGVTARGSTLKDAINAAYDGVNRISFPGAQFRTDIGRKGLSRWPSSR